MPTTFARWVIRITFTAAGAAGLLLDQADTMHSGSAGWASVIALGALTAFELLGWLSDVPSIAIRPAPQPTVIRTLSSNPRTRPRLRRPAPRNAHPDD